MCYHAIGDIMNGFFVYNDKDISMHYSRDNNPKPEKFKMHTHEMYELYYFANGKGTFKIEGTPYRLESGDILIMRPAESHYIDLSPDCAYTRMAIHFNPRMFDGIDKQGKLFAPFTERESGSFNRYRAADFPSSAYRVFIKNIITETENQRLQIISNLLPLLNEIAAAFRSKADERVDDLLIYRILSFINRNLCQNITLDGICGEFYISKPQLCRIFKAATGSTVWDYITVKRLVTARGLIQSGLAPTKVYTECGFSDYSVFYRAYRKKYGVSPSDDSV